MCSISECYCVECGNPGIPIPRPRRRREAGHLKKLYCLHCKKETNHCEINYGYSYEDFQEERKLGRFVNGQRIPLQDLLKCSKFDCPYNKDGKCWNSNNSYKCKHRPAEV